MDSLGNYSQIKIFSFKTLDVVKKIADRKINNSVVKKFWNWFSGNYIKNVIVKTDDAELKQDLEEIYKIIKPLFEKIDTASGIKEGEKLGSTKIPRTRSFKEIMELVEDY